MQEPISRATLLACVLLINSRSVFVDSSGWVVPQEITPIKMLKNDPEAYDGKVIAIEGRVTSLDAKHAVVEDFVKFSTQHSHFARLRLGDTVAVQGKFSHRDVIGEGASLVGNVRSHFYPPRYAGANEPAQTTAAP